MKSKKSWVLFFSLILVFTSFLTACNQEEDVSSAEGQANTAKPLVFTSFYPLYDFAKKIAGDRVEVVNLVPPGAEPHDFEPTPKDIVKLSEADLFLYNGGGFETYIEDIKDAVDTSNMLVINMSEHVDLLMYEESGHSHEEEAEHTEGHAHEEETAHEEDGHAHEEESAHEEDGHAHEETAHEEEAHDHHHGPYDPHFWIDPVRAKQMAAVIKDALVESDEAGKERYEANYQTVVRQLDALHHQFVEVVRDAERKEFITSHAAFGYLAERYGLKQIAITGLTPSNEPSQKELQELIEFAEEHQVKYILFETLVSSKVAHTVREQIGAEALVFNPVSGLTKEELERGEDYFSIMEKNVESLRKALESK